MKILSTEGLTKLIQLVKTAFISVDDVEETTEIDTQLVDEITLAKVATSGDYNDLDGVPTIPVVNNATLTIVQGGTTRGTFTANASSNETINLDAAADIDNNTITKNIHDELQASAIMNSRTNVDSLPIWEGTEQQWITGGNQTWYNWSYGNAGISWTNGTGLSDFYNSVVYGNGLYVAVGGDISANSSNGQTWREFTTLTGFFNGVTYGNGLFVAVGRNRVGRGTFAYSSDGENWTIGSLPVIFNGVTYGNGLFVAVGDRAFAYSSDGQNWMFDSLSDRYLGVTYGNGLFVAIGRDVFAYSSDGENWTESSLNFSDYKAITYGNGLFVAIGSGVFAYSSNGQTWRESTTLTSNYNNITYGNGLFVAVGDGAFAYSSDGENWTESSLNDSYQAIAYGNSLFVAIGDYGSCMYGINDLSSVFTITQNPIIGDVIYSSPAVLSALTIVSVGTGTITLSDTKTYDYNPSGNETTISTVGEAHPNWLCNIEGIGVKKGTTLIADTSGASATQVILRRL